MEIKLILDTIKTIEHEKTRYHYVFWDKEARNQIRINTDKKQPWKQGQLVTIRCD